ncbi:MAG TPA: Hpt domain-containing protein [Steroidobacteraceae bacterium]|nr:Hpt domain-containing protein [Steroidobacteraceae bacterium]
MSDAGERDATAVRTRLVDLTRKFVTRTTGDVAQMRDALARLEAVHGVVDLTALEEIHHLAHRACGTGGTLGLCELSDAAAALERLVEACPADAQPDAAVRAEIAARIDALATQLDLLQ